MVYGYARTSTTDTDLAAQEGALRAAGCASIEIEDGSGPLREQRAKLADLIGRLEKGDTLVATRVDRLAHSIADLQDVVRGLATRGATLKTTEQPIDTGAAVGPSLNDMLGVFATFEATLRRERQLEGIAKAKAAGTYRGRKPSVQKDRVQELLANGVGPTEIAAQLGISRTSVYRATTVPLLEAPKVGRKVQ